MKKIFLILMFAVAAFSCVVEDTGPHAKEDGRTGIARIVMQSSEFANPSTRYSQENESKVDEFDVLAFKYSRQGPEYFLKRFTIPPEEMGGRVQQNGSRLEFQLDVSDIEPDDGMILIVIANAIAEIDEVEALGLLDENTTREEFHDLPLFSGLSWSDPDATFKPFPMYGVSNHVSSTYREPSNVIMMRSAARVDIGVDTRNRNSNLRNYFQIQRVYYMGDLSSAYLIGAHSDENYENPQNPHVPSENMRVIDERKRRDYVMDADFEMKRCFYVTDSPPLNLSGNYNLEVFDESGNKTTYPNLDAANNPYDGPFMIIEATYNNEPNRFYRVDFITSYDGCLPIIRNYNYSFDILAVDGPGWDTMAGAMKDYKSDSQIRVSMEISEDVDWDITYIYYNSTHYLGFNTLSLYFNQDGTPKSGGNTVKILTNLNNDYSNWTFKVRDADAGWLLGVKVSRESGRSSLQIIALPNTSGGFRQGSINVRSGMLNMDITVYQD